MGSIIRRNSSLRAAYNDLKPGDLVLGQLNLKPCEEYIFLDLLSRGIEVVPSPLSQQLSRSKCMQATVFAGYMIPNTSVVRCRKDLILVSQKYSIDAIEKVITKKDRGDCGTGINLWPSIEDLYNAVSLNDSLFPFVVQPFIPDLTDIRVIILGDYRESYWRKNSCSFRNNIHFGGRSGPYELENEQLRMCEKVMERGGFPFAHIDLLVTPDNKTWFGEISLRGGIKGARITAGDYQHTLAELYEDVIAGHNA